MKFSTKYRLCLWKGYFEKGYQLLNYAKYLIALFALSSLNVVVTMVLAAFFTVLCFFLGWFWFRYDWIKAEIEVGNNFNLFVKQMRKRISANRK